MRSYVLAIGLISLSQSADAYCDPSIDRSVRGEFNRADYVALVKADGVTWLDENRQPTMLKKPLSLGDIPGGFDPYLGAYYSTTLIRSFKGKLPLRFRIFSENTTGRTPLRLGQTLILFMYRTRVSDEYQKVGDLTVDYCGNSALARKVPKRVQLIERIASSRR